MSYQVLYRAWRPGTFSEIVGQDATVKTLRRQIVTEHIAHAYLFCGTRGTGKTTASKVFSKAINCLHPKDGDPCCECENCVAIQNDVCMDVIEIDAASNNSVDEIRDLREKVQFPPAMTKFKVYIIDEVHMLSTGAFNALLKTLEEPPKHAVFILATTEPNRLLPTVLSRCQRFDFHRISIPTIISRMKTVLDGIGRQADEEALFEIARAAEGAMRDALSLLDSCLSYTDGVVDAELARNVLGTTGNAFMFDFIDRLIEYDTSSALRMIAENAERGGDPRSFCDDVTEHLRGMLLAGSVEDAVALLEVTEEDAARYAEQSRRMPIERLLTLMDLFMHCAPSMRNMERPRTWLELTVARACHPEQEDESTLIERIDRVEKLLESGAFTRTRKPAAPAASQAVLPAAASSAPSAPAQPTIQPPQEYLDGVETIKESNPSIRKFMDDVLFAAFDGKTLSLRVPQAKMMSLRILESKKKLMEEAFSDSFGSPVAVTLTADRPGAKSPESNVKAVAKRVIEEAYDVFGRENINITD